MEPSRPADPTPLSVLAAAANAGDATALEHLLLRLHVPVHRFYRSWLFAHVDREEVARDLAQEALLRIATRLARCRATSDGTLVAWCLVVARSAGLDYLRRGRAERDARAFAEEVEALGGGAGTGSELTAGLEIVLRILGETMDRESDESHALLAERARAAGSWGETAAAAGLGVPAARRRFQRTIGRLRARVLRALESLPPDERSAALEWLQRAARR